MSQKIPFYLAIPFLIAAIMACSIGGIRQQISAAQQTANALKTKVSGVKTVGGSIIDTAQAIETQGSGIIKTVRAFTTQGVPLLSTIQSISTYSPGFAQTAQSFFKQEIPTGEPPSDIPIFNRDQADSFFGSNQYIFYISPSDYDQVLYFYQLEMPSNGWQYLQSDSHEYPNAAQLNYYKDTRTATIDLTYNSLNHTTVVIINILEH